MRKCYNKALYAKATPPVAVHYGLLKKKNGGIIINDKFPIPNMD